MTTNDFLDRLEAVHDQFEWTLLADTGRYRERRSNPRWHLRATARGKTHSPMFDPVGAVCYADMGRVFETGEWPEAADALGMSPSDGALVVSAANDRTWDGTEGKRKPVQYILSFRRLLLEAVNLVESVGSRR